ncbi:MAG: hypothetical protein ACTTIZ_08330 [Treponema sp.]
MKKIFGIVLLSVMSLSFLVAEEDESSFGKPSFSLKNETTFGLVKYGEDKNKGNFEYDEVENKTTGKFAVGFAIGENFKLKPYISDAIKVGKDAKFKNNDFGIGIGATYKPIDMLTVKFGLGYVSRYTDKKFGNQSVANGVKFNAGLDLAVDSIFLEAGLEYKLTGMFANDKTGAKTDEYTKHNNIANRIILEAKFDFFNFIKEGLNSGLVLSNETNITPEWKKSGNGKDGTLYTDASRTIENEFGIGLHFAPVNYMDFTFLTKVISGETKAYIYDSSWKYSDKSTKGTAVGLSLGLEFSKDMFSFGIEYNPTLSAKTIDEDKNETKAKNMPHEFRLTVGIEL